MKNYAANATDQAPRPLSPAVLRLSQSLAIDGLPSVLSTLAAGQVYVVYANRSPARDAFFWRTAAKALRSPVTVLSMRDPETIASALRDQGVNIDAPGAFHPRANICALDAVPGRDNGELLMEALEALSDQCAMRGSQFLIEGVAACFAWQDEKRLMQQGERLARWCAEHRHGALLVMSPPLVAEGVLPPALADFQTLFGGMAQLLQREGEYRWEVAYWRDNRNNLAASESIPLRFSSGDHHLVAVVDAEDTDVVGAGLLAPDETVVLVTRDARVNERSAPRKWQVFADNAAVVAAADKAIAATIVLQHAHDESLPELAKQVNTLRRQCGQALKIVVREENITVRFELLLLNLGANLVIPTSLPIAQVEVMVNGVQGQRFSRPVPSDYRAVLAAVMRDSETGYVPAHRFIELARAAVERSRTIRLPNVAMRLLLQPDVAGIDALQVCEMRRAGDLCTASGDSVYIFLFACHVDHATKASQKIFKRPLGELFQGELRCGDRDSILAMLDTLESAIKQMPPPDYSSMVTSRAAPSVAGQIAPEALQEEMPIVALGAQPATTTVLPEMDTASEQAAPAAVRRAPRVIALPVKASR